MRRRTVAVWPLLFNSAAALVITYQNTTSPRYESVSFALGPTSYHVANQSVVVVSSMPPLAPTVAESLTGRVLVFRNGYISAWIDACSAAGCAGLLQCTQAGDSRTEKLIWAWIYRGTKVPFASIPTAFVTSAAACDSLYALPQAGLRVTFSSDEYANPTEAALASTPALICFYMSTMLNVVSIVLAIYKLVSFLVASTWTLRPIPLWPLLVISTQLIASVFRVVFAANSAFARLQGITYTSYRLTITGYLPFTFASTMSVGLAMHQHLYKGHPVSKRHQATIAAFVVTLLIVFTMDFAFTLYTAISGVSAVNTAFLSVFYLVLNVPCSLCFIKYGSSVAKSLLENYSISNGERFRSIIFAKRTALSGALGVVVLAGQVLFMALYTVSPFAYLTTYTLATAAGTLQGILFQLAFRAKNSIFSRYTARVGATDYQASRTSTNQ
ncbi:Uncharacterized protein PBTT_10198 [Plasmodiophora brassicae]